MDASTFWITLGIAGGVLFYGRFYVQWLASERQGRVVVPMAFWYMSMAGALMTFAYSIWRHSPGAAFGLCFNVIVYARNMVLRWREAGRLGPVRNGVVHGLAVLVTLVAVTLTILAWRNEWTRNARLSHAEAMRNWFWLGMWAIGQAAYFARFGAQWLLSEWRGRSVIPRVFWLLSCVGAFCQAPGFFMRPEPDWINGFGQGFNLIIYARSLVLSGRNGKPSSGG
ncbi:MAG: lipid-A-disaccharide synthase N-terminal domain-containing protein [Candidatus Hydrogenedentes bacterium]|nr:lipid-A-disaccharide synthase N-terminal domain-containing protein [Candidatus Hydrogenedentota bacterium]